MVILSCSTDKVEEPGMHGRLTSKEVHFDRAGQALADFLEVTHVHVIRGPLGVVAVVAIHVATHGQININIFVWIIVDIVLRVTRNIRKCDRHVLCTSGNDVEHSPVPGDQSERLANPLLLSSYFPNKHMG